MGDSNFVRWWMEANEPRSRRLSQKVAKRTERQHMGYENEEPLLSGDAGGVLVLGGLVVGASMTSRRSVLPWLQVRRHRHLPKVSHSYF